MRSLFDRFVRSAFCVSGRMFLRKNFMKDKRKRLDFFPNLMKYFRKSDELISQGCRRCLLRAQMTPSRKKFLFRKNFSSLNTFEIWVNNIRILSNFIRKVCQDCILRVHRNIFGLKFFWEEKFFTSVCWI